MRSNIIVLETRAKLNGAPELGERDGKKEPAAAHKRGGPPKAANPGKSDSLATRRSIPSHQLR